jgi:hypothetical protein
MFIGNVKFEGVVGAAVVRQTIAQQMRAAR